MINKLKALYIKKGISQKDMAAVFGMSPAGFNNKMRHSERRFDLTDIILFAEKCDLKVAFVDSDNNVVETLTRNDIEER